MDLSTRPNKPEDGMGYLILHVTTARGAIPLEGAFVSIRPYLSPEEPAGGDVIASAVSGRSGNTPPIALFAPSRSESLEPGVKKPFSTYTAQVRLEGYFDQTYIGLPIFDGITAVQPADMTPLPSRGQSGTTQTDRSEQFFESPENGL